jgi:hypothetical protein
MTLKLSAHEENLEEVDDLLQEALTRLDAAGRFDVSAHIDLALHQLRGTRFDFQKHNIDIPE